MLNFMPDLALHWMLSLESMDQPVELPVLESLVMSPENLGKPLPPHLMTSASSSHARALETSCVPAPPAARKNLPFLGSSTWKWKLLAAAAEGRATALTLQTISNLYSLGIMIFIPERHKSNGDDGLEKHFENILSRYLTVTGKCLPSQESSR